MEKRINYLLMNLVAIGFILFVVAFPIININASDKKPNNNGVPIKGNKNKSSDFKIPKVKSKGYNYNRKIGGYPNMNMPNIGKGKMRKFK